MAPDLLVPEWPRELTMAGSQGALPAAPIPLQSQSPAEGSHRAPKGRPHTPGGQRSEGLGVLGTMS